MANCRDFRILLPPHLPRSIHPQRPLNLVPYPRMCGPTGRFPAFLSLGGAVPWATFVKRQLTLHSGLSTVIDSNDDSTKNSDRPALEEIGDRGHVSGHPSLYGSSQHYRGLAKVRRGRPAPGPHQGGAHPGRPKHPRLYTRHGRRFCLKTPRASLFVSSFSVAERPSDSYGLFTHYIGSGYLADWKLRPRGVTSAGVWSKPTGIWSWEDSTGHLWGEGQHRHRQRIEIDLLSGF